ncbi:MAG: hypothetical protein ACI94Y_004606 [Maribacter sp.]|jgi:hypothetical protein
MTNFIKFFTTIIFVFVSLICCLGQDVTLYSQADVDAFDPSTTVINGFLQLNGSNSPDPITNLDNLSNLTFISGGLNIYNNVILTNLDGLSNLTSIGVFVVYVTILP